MSIFKQISGSRLRSKFIWYRTSAGWIPVNRVRADIGGADVDVGPIYLRINSNTSDYNVFTAAGSPTLPVTVIVEIDSGVIVSASDTSTPAFDTGTGWVTGTTILLINNGQILGKGGAGGNGAAVATTSCTVSTVGADGGPAMNLQTDVVVLVAGMIYGGGGGGGGGGCRRATYLVTYGWGGGGGGGGCGTGAAGVRGNVTGNNYNYPGVNGSVGTTEAGGDEGNGGHGNELGNNGGKGGGPGEDGAAGQNTSDPGGVFVTTCSQAGKAGGTAGKAVELNGNTITWMNDYSNVLGAVS